MSNLHETATQADRSSIKNGAGDRQVYWLVGSSWGRSDDQTDRFINEGIWVGGDANGQPMDIVNEIEPGDPIAIKAAFVRRKGLPFENRGNPVSVMAIKAVGTVKENPRDGSSLKVDWKPLPKHREWYFYTYQGTVWRVEPDNWKAKRLIDFVFNNLPQEIDRFRNAPFWRERYGDVPDEDQKFGWAPFYQELADKLRAYRNDRETLLAAIKEIMANLGISFPFTDQNPEGEGKPLTDICPFTSIGIFNRGIKVNSRRQIASELADFLGIESLVPIDFDGIPIINNQNSWFFSYEFRRKPDDINKLWQAFEAALSFADSPDYTTQAAFEDTFNTALEVRGIKWNITFALYWIRPWHYLPLDQRSRTYITSELPDMKHFRALSTVPTASQYLELLDALKERFEDPEYPVHSFPELSLAAYNYLEKEETQPDAITTDVPARGEGIVEEVQHGAIDFYNIESIVSDGCFLPRPALDNILLRLKSKKNLILQGPPGTGKTWLARRLAFALMGKRDETRLRAMQFHPNLSYEDFVRGWRPSGDGRLSLADGPFLQLITAAQKDPNSVYVMLIEEINRGNPAQIFGEMLTLLEADKRNSDEALELSYRRTEGERIYIPKNLYLIGTMNIADRSLALVDLAFRRRFAFVDLEPQLNEVWRNWCINLGISDGLIRRIETSIEALNEQIASDTSLGKQFRIGHSFVTPHSGMNLDDPDLWFRQVVETEIGPLLDEYWFDATAKVERALEQLLGGVGG